MRSIAVTLTGVLAVVLAVVLGLAGTAVVVLALSSPPRPPAAESPAAESPAAESSAAESSAAESSAAESSAAQSAPFAPAAGQPRLEPAPPTLADVNSPRRAVARTSIATRHVPTPAESALTGALHPATDRVMVIIVGWVLLALVGGGWLAGPRCSRLGPRPPRLAADRDHQASDQREHR